MPTNGTPALHRVVKEIPMVNFNDPRLDRPSWRGRTNVDALTIACIEHAEQIKRDRWPDRPELHHEFVCTQGSYQGDSGDPDSGTTHRLGGGVDLRWCGHPECYWSLRKAGMFIWHRTPDQGPWPDHFHGAPLGHPYVDDRLAAQEDSYLARGNGLGGVDDGPRLNPIPRPVWPWPPEDDMTPEQAQQLERIEASTARTERMVERLRQRALAQTQRVIHRLDELADGASAEDVRRVRADAGELAAALTLDDED